MTYDRPWLIGPISLIAVAAALQAYTPFAASYLDTLSEGTQSARKDLPAIERAADEVARRLSRGGNFVAASVRPDFASEGAGRAGGLALLKVYGPGSELTSKDAVVFSWVSTTSEQDLALAGKLHASGALVVGIGPKISNPAGSRLTANLDVLLESSLPLEPTVLGPFQGETYPLVSLQNLTILWAFTGEVVSALTRQGSMPVVLQSILVPGGRERNDSLRDRQFHKQHTVPPIPAGELGRAYLKNLGACYTALRREEVGSIENVAQACERVRKSGHRIYAFLTPHFPKYQIGAPGDPGYMQPLEHSSGVSPSSDELKSVLKPGDLFFFLGYYQRQKEAYQAAHQAGAQIVEVITGTGAPETVQPLPDYVIHPKWPYGDALVSVPGYDIKILPSSGIVQSAIYWAVIGSMRADEDAGKSTVP